MWNPPHARITPAYAGKSSHYRSHHCNNKDHPRLCGEKGIYTNVQNTVEGSPPPMRGKADRSYNKYKMYGITPAYAGKRVSDTPAMPKSRDHPRLCGEKLFLSGIAVYCLGSPPPMRGKATSDPEALTHTGITPAYAGKSAISTQRNYAK